MSPKILRFFLCFVCVLAVSCHSSRVESRLQVRYPNAEIEKKTDDQVVWYLITLNSNSGTRLQTQGACNQDGDQIIAPGKYPYVGFGKTCYYVGNSANEGICDLDGNEIIAPDRYIYVEAVPQYYLVMGNDGGTGICDLLGNEIVPCKFFNITHSDSDGITIQETADSEPYRYDPSASSYDDELAYESMGDSDSPSETPLPDASIVEKYIESGSSSGAANYLNEFVEEYGSDPEAEYQCAVLLAEVIKGYSIEMMKGIAEMNQPLVISLQVCVNAANNNQSMWLMSAAGKGHRQANQLLQFKIGATGGGYNSGYNSNNNSNNGYSGQSHSSTCSLCNGRGWVAGNSTPTYGNMGPKWCSQCGEVSQSHSHDTCPSCDGSGSGS